MTISLDRHQRDAVNARSAAATNVVAGAGTGKTTVLVERFLKLVREDGVSPDRILALTFTLKAAAEMRHRIYLAVMGSMPARVDELYGAWIMNFHQFGLRLIRENAPAFGIDPDADVVTPAQFRRIERLLKRRFVEGRIEGVPHDFGGEIPPPTKMDSRFDMFFNVAMKCRSDGFDAAGLSELCTSEDTDGYRAYVEAIIAVASAYDDQLRRRNLIDFSDMITVPARGLERSESIRSRYVARFDHILVDEFQDTSRAQNQLLKILSAGDFENVTVVGDRKQAIYRWRDARVENIRDFPGDEAPLKKNYRSRQNILDIAHAFISTDEEFADSADNIHLEADRGENADPVVLFHPEENEDWEAEAEALAAWVLHLTRGVPCAGLPALDPGDRLGHEDIAVLLRSLKPGHGLPAIERAFERRGIPYAVVGGANAAETRALESWHALLSLLLPGNRVRELLTVLEGEPWCIPDAVLYQLLRDVKRRTGGIDLLGDDDIARVESEEVAASLREVRSLVDEMRERMITTDFRSFVAWTIDESPLAIRLFHQGAAERLRSAQDLVHEVFEALEQVSRSDAPAGLLAFLDHVRAAIDDKKFREESDVRLPSSRVRIMTIHQSKGLEFPAVAVAGIKPPRASSDRFFLSHEKGVFFSSDEGRRWNRHHAETEEKEYEVRMEDQEARCLLYVAMTRAEDHLWVSSPFRDGVRRRGRSEKPSLFHELLGCVSAVDPLVVLRRAPEAAVEPRDDGAASERIDANDLSGAVQDWRRAQTMLETVWRDAPPSPRPLDVVSWPELYAYHRCPLQYRYRYHTRYSDVLGATEHAPRGGEDGEVLEGVALPRGVTPAEYGVLVHESLRRVYGEGCDAAAAVRAAAEGLGAGKVAEDAARALVDGVLASDLGEAGAGVLTEEPFQVRFGALMLQGVFDRLERAADGLRVIDYKVGVESPAHDFQVRVYAYALGRIDDADVNGYVCYLRSHGAHVKRATSRASVEAIGPLAEALESALRSGEFEPTPGAACADCAYRAVCPAAR